MEEEKEEKKPIGDSLNNGTDKKDENPTEEETPAKELEECKKKCEEYLTGWKRERADFINYKKNEMEKMGMLIKYANEELILKILPILDNIYLAEKELPEKMKDSKWTEGFLQIKIQLSDFLQKEGIEEIKTIGEKFDPTLMEAVVGVEQKTENEEQKTETVVEEIQKGYTLHGKIIRPAKVKIIK